MLFDKQEQFEMALDGKCFRSINLEKNIFKLVDCGTTKHKIKVVCKEKTEHDSGLGVVVKTTFTRWFEEDSALHFASAFEKGEYIIVSDEDKAKYFGI